MTKWENDGICWAPDGVYEPIQDMDRSKPNDLHSLRVLES